MKEGFRATPCHSEGADRRLKNLTCRKHIDSSSKQKSFSVGMTLRVLGEAKKFLCRNDAKITCREQTLTYIIPNRLIIK